MTIIAMMFGGIMEGTHQLEVVVNKLKKLAKVLPVWSPSPRSPALSPT